VQPRSDRHFKRVITEVVAGARNHRCRHSLAVPVWLRLQSSRSASWRKPDRRGRCAHFRQVPSAELQQCAGQQQTHTTAASLCLRSWVTRRRN